MQTKFQVGVSGGDEITLTLTLNNQGHIEKSQWSVTGSLELVAAAQKFKAQIYGDPAALTLPQGTAFADLLLKELVLRIKGEWPDGEGVELCHCRNIPQKIVERAILLGADTVEKVRQRTSANTGCGTCLPEVERLLKLYLK